MERKNIGLKIFIIILCLLVVGLTGYIVYDKLLLDDNDKCVNNNISNENGSNNVIDNNGNTNDNEEKIGFVKPEEHVEIDKNIKSELTEVLEFVYDYYDWSNGYCGAYSHDDKIFPENTGFVYANYYTASSKYNSFDEMINHLKGYMTENVIYEKIVSRDRYIEKDGKLYCPDYGKGGSIYSLEDVRIKYSKPWINGYYVTMETTLVDGYTGNSYTELFDVTFDKKYNKWIITSFERFKFYYE